MATSFPTLEQLNKARTDASQFTGGPTYSLIFNVDGKQYNFVPKNIAENGGMTAGDNTYLLPYFTSLDNLKDFGSKAQEIDLSSIGVNKYLQSQGLSEKGYLIPFGSTSFDSQVNPVPTETFGGELNGLKVIDGQVVYGLTGGAGRRYATTTGEVHNPYIVPGGGFLGDFGRTLQNMGPLAGFIGNLIVPGLGTGISIGSAVAQGASPEDLAKNYIAAQIGNEVGADIGGVEGQIAGGATSGLISGQSPEDALKGSLVNTGLNQAGSSTPSNLLTPSTNGTTATPEYIPESNIGQGTPSSTSGFYTGQGTTGANNMADDYNYGSPEDYGSNPDGMMPPDINYGSAEDYGLNPDGMPSPNYLASLTPAVRTSVQRALMGGGGSSNLSSALNLAASLNSLTGGGLSSLLGIGPGSMSAAEAQRMADPFAPYRANLGQMYSTALQPGTETDVTKMPGYSQYTSGVLNPAMEASKRSAAASGLMYSGKESAALGDIAQRGYYGFMSDYLNRLAQGSGATVNPAQAGGLGLNQNMANQQAFSQGLGGLGQGIAGLYGNQQAANINYGATGLPSSTFTGSGDASWMSEAYM